MKRRARTRIWIVAMALVAVLAAPAAAQASQDLAITQHPSANVVDAGSLVTIDITVTNKGTEPPPYTGEAIVDIFSLSGHGQPADNPYQSSSTSQGKCVAGEAPPYQELICQLGPLAPGASAHISVVVKVNQTMNHLVALLPNVNEGGYVDDDNSNNESVQRITASVPPVLTGPKSIELRGLPTGCAGGDFTLRVVPKFAGVKKIVAALFLGFDETGEGTTWQRSTKSTRLTAKVPISKISNPELGKLYQLKVKVRRKGAAPLKRTVEFQVC
jgi:Domain of unknown function DUF11